MLQLIYTIEDYRFGFNGKENLNELTGSTGTHLDFGVRVYDSRLGRWLVVDPLAAKYPELSPYTYVGNMPIEAIDVNGEDIYIIIYTTGNHRGDDMLKAAADTREKAIKNSQDFNPKEDIVVMISVADISDIEMKVEKNIELLSPVWGSTKEVGIFSHSGKDGPTGTIGTRTNQLDEKQMKMEGWGGIDWNWSGEDNLLGVYGCQSASFAEKYSQQDNMKGVFVAGQNGDAFPSIYTNVVENTEEIVNDDYSKVENVYLVSSSIVAKQLGITNGMSFYLNGKKDYSKRQEGDIKEMKARPVPKGAIHK
ncbi:MAG: hypothetical protein JXR58_07975 [Bacteroidales bacterium]|nr:hypothetical protein [Bacteroidales bacterium]